MYQCNMKHATLRIYYSAASCFKTQSEAGRIFGYPPLSVKVYKFTVYSLHYAPPTFPSPKFWQALQRYSVTLRIFHYADFQAREHY